MTAGRGPGAFSLLRSASIEHGTKNLLARSKTETITKIRRVKTQSHAFTYCALIVSPVLTLLAVRSDLTRDGPVVVSGLNN